MSDATRRNIQGIDAWLRKEMKARGFLVLGDKPGHWKSAGWSGHALEFRQRTLRRWVTPHWPNDLDRARKKLKDEIDNLIAKQVSA